MNKALISTLIIFSLNSNAVPLAKNKAEINHTIEKNRNEANQLALHIANLAEYGYQEYDSSNALQKHLKSNGFSIQTNAAGMPTAFIATYGQGNPVIGIVAEFDALPGFSQAPLPHKEVVKGLNAGHACGHHLLGVAATQSAIAVKEWMLKHHIKGTIKVFGSPAEEGGGGKVYMSRAGLVDNVDVMLNWHPASFNNSNPLQNLANFSGKFRFYGQSAHAAAAPEKGRSALDGVEAMNFMVNAMREHVAEGSRIHYVITNGGKAPNVVPDFAEVYYYARHNNPEIARDTWHRIENAAQGAALGTDTKVKIEITNATYSMLPNSVLSKLVHDNLLLVGGVKYTQEEAKFAQEIQKTLPGTPKAITSATMIEPFDNSNAIYAVSSDVGDMSWNTPTNWLNTATWVPGTAPHSWQAVAAGTMSIGLKGMEVAAKTMAFTAADIFSSPEKLTEITAEFNQRRGADFKYIPLIGDRKPPLNYRK